MNYTKIPLFAMMTGRLAWLGERQTIIAQNIANAETPGYKPSDLERPDFSSMLDGQLGGPTLRLTHRGHLAGRSPVSRFDVVPADTGNRDRPSGNAVVLEDELIKVGQTAMDYQLTTNLYRRAVALVRTAIGRRGGA